MAALYSNFRVIYAEESNRSKEMFTMDCNYHYYTLLINTPFFGGFFSLFNFTIFHPFTVSVRVW
jgi:hypothetical protein